MDHEGGKISERYVFPQVFRGYLRVIVRDGVNYPYLLPVDFLQACLAYVSVISIMPTTDQKGLSPAMDGINPAVSNCGRVLPRTCRGFIIHRPV